MLYSIARFIVTPIMHLLIDVKYEGQENQKASGGYILCANHRAWWDPILVAFGIKKRHITFMAKKELFKFKPFGALIRAFGAFPINRGAADSGAIKNAEEIVKNGKILLIFPEGTRSKTGEPLRAKSGAAYIAAEAGVDIIPVAICYEGKYCIRKKVTVCYGKPIKSDEIVIRKENKSADAKNAMGLVFGRIVDMLNSHLGTNYTVK